MLTETEKGKLSPSIETIRPGRYFSMLQFAVIRYLAYSVFDAKKLVMPAPKKIAPSVVPSDSDVFLVRVDNVKAMVAIMTR